jgi:hypothetical protein
MSGFVLAFYVGLLLLPPLLREEVQQPIQFNHQAHQDLDCTGCHEFAATESFAGLPPIDTCMLCHEISLTESPEEEKLRTLSGEGNPIEWQQLFRQPPDVFYSHRRHVEIAGLECRQCHGDIGESTQPPGHVQNLTMSDCIACHEQNQTEAGCVDCHR